MGGGAELSGCGQRNGSLGCQTARRDLRSGADPRDQEDIGFGYSISLPLFRGAGASGSWGQWHTESQYLRESTAEHAIGGYEMTVIQGRRSLVVTLIFTPFPTSNRI